MAITSSNRLVTIPKDTGNFPSGVDDRLPGAASRCVLSSHNYCIVGYFRRCKFSCKPVFGNMCMFYFRMFTHAHIAHSVIFKFSYVLFSYARLTYKKYENLHYAKITCNTEYTL